MLSLELTIISSPSGDSFCVKSLHDPESRDCPEGIGASEMRQYVKPHDKARQGVRGGVRPPPRHNVGDIAPRGLCLWHIYDVRIYDGWLHTPMYRALAVPIHEVLHIMCLRRNVGDVLIFVDGVAVRGCVAVGYVRLRLSHRRIWRIETVGTTS